MHRLLTMKRLSILFLSLFAVLMAGMFAYERLVVAPGDRCEAGGGWWDPEGGQCAKPVSIAEQIELLEGLSRAEASAVRNRELVAIEDSLAAQQRARDADADRQRAALAAQ